MRPLACQVVALECTRLHVSALDKYFTAIVLSESAHHGALATGIAMALATLAFWSGRHKYTHVPPHASRFLRSSCSLEGARALCKLIGLFGFFAVYWSLYDKSGSAWVLQVSVSECF